MIKTVAIYLRLSREKGEDVDSLSNHRTTLIKIAERNDYSYTIYSDGIASSQDDSREQYLKMIEDIKKGMYDALLAHDVDRLGRKGSTLLALGDTLEKYCPTVLTPSQSYDLRQDTSKMMFAFSSIFSENEYRQISKRLQQGKYRASEDGKFLGSVEPFGYKKDKDKRLVPDEAEKKVYRMAVDLALQGNNFHTIADKLNEAGHRGKLGKPFANGTVHRLFNKPVYRGIHTYKNSAGEVYKRNNHGMSTVF